MPAADSKALRAAVKDGSYAPAYYLYGDDDYLKDEELKRLLEAAVDPATRDFNFEQLRGSELDAETIGSILSTPPMMADRRVVVVRDAGALKKDARTMLDSYLKNPAPDVLLILTAPAGTKEDKGLVSKATAVEFAPLTGNRIPKWIVYYVEHDLHTSISEPAVRLLQEAVGTELAQLRIELDKLINFTNGGAIDEAAIAAVVGVRPGETMGDFLDAVARRDARTAIAMLGPVLSQPKSNGVTMIMALTSQTLCIGWAQAARERGMNPGKVSGELFNVLKSSGSVFTGRSWGEFVSTCAREAERWSSRAVDDALVALFTADAAIKETRLSTDEQILANLVLAMCGTSIGKRAA
ncbi:MAG TPA: DNA polymerase III subunit delta [Gemmatimonadaceae bacterium]|jgi:DNA polymerase-3 subunit delta